jgi:hypothetical protein
MTISVGDTVTVTKPDHTYDCYFAWPDRAEHVPHFEYGGVPQRGQEYTVTYVGTHEFPNSAEVLYVLDGRYIVGPRVFEELED